MAHASLQRVVTCNYVMSSAWLTASLLVLQIQQEIKKKERAIEYFANKYQSSSLSDDEVRLCLYSICDNNSFLNSNRYTNISHTTLRPEGSPGQESHGQRAEASVFVLPVF